MGQTDTTAAWQAAIAVCRAIYAAKAEDYGASWTILRTGAILDQLYIKAKRIRTLEEKGVSKVGEGIEPEYQGIVNYSLMALLLLEPEVQRSIESHQYNPPLELLLTWYDSQVQRVFDTFEKKNHDYGEAWREMATSSFTDMILVRVLRMKQIVENAGQTRVSEGLDANFVDIINYAVFALIRFAEARTA